jgi:hypothetical protein
MSTLSPDNPESPLHGVQLPSGNAKPMAPSCFCGNPVRFMRALVGEPGPERLEVFGQNGALESVTDERTLEGERKRITYVLAERCQALLQPSDWYVIRALDPSVPQGKRGVPDHIAAFRSEVRQAQDDLQALVDAATSVEDLDSIDLSALLAFNPFDPTA